MYKLVSFRDSEIFGRVAEVEFSLIREGSYAYLLGDFNAFNEGSFRMEQEGKNWKIKIALPEGVWHYAFSIDGKFVLDPDNPERRVYTRKGYKFHREVNVARIVKSDDLVFHTPSLLYLYEIFGRVHVLLRTQKGVIKGATFLGEKHVPMRKKASDELFDYFEVIVEGGDKRLNYSFEVLTMEGAKFEYGQFKARPFSIEFPTWVIDRVFYQIMPDKFARSRKIQGIAYPKDKYWGGDLIGIKEKIDHLVNLGINAIYLTPIFSSLTYHGYDIVDYFHVARRLGGDRAFVDLLSELKRFDIKVILDGVFHHTSFFHPYFQDVVRKGENSSFKNFYRIIKFPVVSKEFLQILHSKSSWEEKYKKIKSLGWNYESFFLVWIMPRLNHDNPKVREFIKNVILFWTNKGVDGFRMDVAHGVPPEVWKEVREALPKEKYLIGEVMDDARLWLFDKFHGVMNYRLYDAILRFFGYEEITAEEFLNELELLSSYYGPAEYLMYNFLDNHDVERFLDIVGDKRKYVCALVFLMTYKGIPSLFYGDEIGLRGINLQGMESSRAPMLWNEEEWDQRILEITKTLVKIRKNNKALLFGNFVPVKFKRKFMVYKREHMGERTIVAINYSNSRVKELGITIPEYSGVIINEDKVKLIKY